MIFLSEARLLLQDLNSVAHAQAVLAPEKLMSGRSTRRNVEEAHYKHADRTVARTQLISSPKSRSWLLELPQGGKGAASGDHCPLGRGPNRLRNPWKPTALSASPNTTWKPNASQWFAWCRRFRGPRKNNSESLCPCTKVPAPSSGSNAETPADSAWTRSSRCAFPALPGIRP